MNWQVTGLVSGAFLWVVFGSFLLSAVIGALIDEVRWTPTHERRGFEFWRRMIILGSLSLVFFLSIIVSLVSLILTF